MVQVQAPAAQRIAPCSRSWASSSDMGWKVWLDLIEAGPSMSSRQLAPSSYHLIRSLPSSGPTKTFLHYLVRLPASPVFGWFLAAFRSSPVIPALSVNTGFLGIPFYGSRLFFFPISFFTWRLLFSTQKGKVSDTVTLCMAAQFRVVSTDASYWWRLSCSLKMQRCAS